MKNQQRTTGSFRLSSLIVIVLMIAAMVCTCTVLASANNTTGVTLEDMTIDGFTPVDGIPTKEYDKTATTAVTVTLKDRDYGYGDGMKLQVKAATLDSVDAGDRVLTVEYKVVNAAGKEQTDIEVPNTVVSVKITPKKLTWAGDATAKVTYDPAKNGSYTIAGDQITLPALSDTGVTAKIAAVTVSGVDKVGTYEVQITNFGWGANYTADPLKLTVTVDPVTITSIDWANDYTFEWGDAAIDNITVYGKDAAGTKYQLAAKLEGYNGKAGTYNLTVSSPDAVNMVLDSSITTKTKTVTVDKKTITVSMPDMNVIGDKGLQEAANIYQMVVSGVDKNGNKMPEEILKAITYTVNNAPFAGASDHGQYTVTAKLPASDNYKFVNAQGNEVTTLTATLSINKLMLNLGTTEDKPYEVILVSNNGFAANVTATLTSPELERKAIRGLKQHEAFSLKLENAAAGQTFTVYIPVNTSLVGKYASELTAADVYIYDEATGERVKASDKGYTVTMDTGYFAVEGVSAAGSVTFIVAPEYNPPFWLTAWGIALIIFLILALLVLLFLIGMYLRRAKEEEEAAVAVDSGEAEEPVATEPEELVDEEAFLAEAADAAAEAVADTDAETDGENTEGVDGAVAEAMADLMGAVVMIPTEDIYPVEDFKAVVDAVVADAMQKTMELPEVEEIAEETEETVEAVAEEAEATETAVEEAEAPAEEAVAEEAAEETVEVAEEAVEATEEAVEATEEVAEEAAAEEAAEEETAEETAEAEETVEEEPAVVKAVNCNLTSEEMTEIVADSVNEAFELVTVDGVTPDAVEGITMDTITDAVDSAADEHIPGNWTVDMAKTVTEAVVAELAARLLSDEEPPVDEEPVEEVVEEPVEEPVEEEPAVEAFAEVEEPAPAAEPDEDDDDNDNDNEEEEEEAFFGGFGSMKLNWIDVMEQPEAYAEMLEQESRGEVQVVTRYRRSYLSRMIQSQGNVQEYYNILKNALLSYKGIKNRVSWNYEAFNRGRLHIAKINAKTKTLYLYLALDPAELVDTKYGIVDVSSKKKYASVPVLMKIKGERKFKYALELIDKLCAETMALPKLEVEEVDYREPYRTTEQLVQEGIVKKLAATIPVEPVAEAEVTEEAPAEATSATVEAQEVTFVEPTTVAAVEEASEEIAAAAEAPAAEEPKDI